MLLSAEDLDLFYRMHKSLMLFVNGRLKLFKPPAGSSRAIVAFPPDQRLKLRDALLEHLDLIDAFVAKNPYDLDPGELDIIRSWTHLRAGNFYVFRHLKKHTIFLSGEEPMVAFGVLALSEPFEEVVGPDIPYFCKAVLLPFRDRIVYDGLLSGYNVILGGNIRRELKDAYNEAKRRQGVVTSLPVGPDAKPEETFGKSRLKTPRFRGDQQSPPSVRKPKPKAGGKGRPPLIGQWRITEMEQWDQDFVNAEVEGFFRFDRGGSGEFHFGYVHGFLNYRTTEHDDRPAAVFTFEGNDEMDPCSGRGWAIQKGSRLVGKIVFHSGDESRFKAEPIGGSPGR